MCLPLSISRWQLHINQHHSHIKFWIFKMKFELVATNSVWGKNTRIRGNLIFFCFAYPENPLSIVNFISYMPSFLWVKLMLFNTHGRNVILLIKDIWILLVLCFKDPHPFNLSSSATLQVSLVLLRKHGGDVVLVTKEYLGWHLKARLLEPRHCLYGTDWNKMCIFKKIK